MRRVVISHSQLPKRPQVSLFHTQTNQKLNGKAVMLSCVQDLSLPCCSHPAFVAAEPRNSGPPAALLLPSSLDPELEQCPAVAPGRGHCCRAQESGPETPEHRESPEHLSRLGLVPVW